MPHTGFSKQGVGRNLVVLLEGACGRVGVPSSVQYRAIFIMSGVKKLPSSFIMVNDANGRAGSNCTLYNPFCRGRRST